MWKKVTNKNFLNSEDILNSLKNKNYKISHWIQDIFLNNKNKIVMNKEESFDLYRIKVSDLGFDRPSELCAIYDSFNKKGYRPVPPIIALLSRAIYDEQPKGEWPRIAVPMNSMIDSDGVPHLPKLGSALNMLFIETYWSYPHAIFHPHNEFVVTK